MSDINGALSTSQRIPSASTAPGSSAGPAAAPPAEPMRAPGTTARARRSPRLVVIGVLCAVLGALGMTAAFSQAHQTQTVVAVARTVPRGMVIESADLTTVTIGAVPGVSTVPADALASLVGQTALVDLAQGSLVGAGSFGNPVVPQGTTQLGLKLAAGRLPDTTMPPGTKVILVSVSNAAEGVPAATAATSGQTYAATLISMPRELPDGITWVVDVSVAQKDAAVVAELAAAGRLVLARSS